MKEKLIEVWKLCETKQLAKLFEEYMKSLNIKKYDARRRDNSNIYLIESTYWNRVQCHYFDKSLECSEEDLLIVLRKKSGNYFIIAKKGKRAFEVDYSGIKHYEEALLNEIIEEHKPLFDSIFKELNIA